jgi:sacsin
MQPLFDILFQCESQVLWSKMSPELEEGKWISLKHATIITSSDVSPAIHQVLSTCGLQLVDYSDCPQVREAVRVANKKTTELTPAVARQAIRSKKGMKCQALPPAAKHELLWYCLLDGKFNELEGLELLPLADGSFVPFAQGMGDNACYVCNEKHPSGLLPGLEHRLVDVSSQNLALHKEILKVATTNKTQLQKLNPDVVARLLPNCMPPEWKNKNIAPISGSSFSRKWFETFWEWVVKQNLDLFKDRMVLPVVKYCSKQSEVCVARLVTNSCVIYVSEDSVLNNNRPLLEGLEKFDVYFTGTLEQLFPCLHSCKSLKEYVYTTSPYSIVSALRNAYSQQQIHTLERVSLTREEAEAIQHFLPDLQSKEEVIKHLPIFVCENSSSLHSLVSAAQQSWGGKAALVTTNSCTKFECNAEFLPPNLIMLCSTYHQNRLVKPHTDTVNTLHWVDFVLQHLFPMISKGEYPPSKVELLMEEILEQLSSPKLYRRDALVKQTRGIPFLRKDKKGTLVPPSKLFDPSKPLLQDIVPGEMFPKKPFNKPSLLHQLRECGLRQALTAQEVLKVMYSISSKKATTAEISRAKAVLEYLDRNQSLMETTVQFENKERELFRNSQKRESGYHNRLYPQSITLHALVGKERHCLHLSVLAQKHLCVPKGT